MKKSIFTVLLSAFTILGMAQTADFPVEYEGPAVMKTGTIVDADYAVDICKTNPEICRGISVSYLVQDDISGEIYVSDPTHLIGQIGQKAQFVARELSYQGNNKVLWGRWDGKYSDGAQPSSNASQVSENNYGDYICTETMKASMVSLFLNN